MRFIAVQPAMSRWADEKVREGKTIGLVSNGLKIYRNFSC